MLSIDPKDLLVAIHNNLNQCFFTAEKAAAKRLFGTLSDGTEVPFMVVSGGELGDVNSYLLMDKSEFKGKLNFSRFRNILAAHLYRIAQKLSDDEKLNIFTQEGTGHLIYHIPGVLETDGEINVLVTGVEDFRPGRMTIKLQFLDSTQFIQAPQ